MSNQNVRKDFAGLTNKTRIHKPPGGDTNDIFGLEERQKYQQEKKQRLDIDCVKETKDAFETGIDTADASQSKAASEFAGITDQTRVRKPPGGYTNDIFDMETRQKLTAESSLSKQGKNVIETSDACKPKNMPCDVKSNEPLKIIGSDAKLPEPLKDVVPDVKLPEPPKDNQLADDETDKAIPLQELDKENAEMPSDKGSASYGKDHLEENDLNDIDKSSKSESKTYFRRNPITGEGCKVKVKERSKLTDCSNRVDEEDSGQNPKEMKIHRPSIRVRHPPGGASSNIF